MKSSEREQSRARAEDVDESKQAASQVVLPSIRVWGAWLGISALLALSGFIVKIAQEQFLGISLTQWGPAELSTTAGRWLIDTVLLVCQVCMLHPYWTVTWAAVVFAGVVISLEFPQDSRMFRASRAFVVALTFLSLSLLVMQVQLPLTTIEGWLTTSLGQRFSPPAASEHSTEASSPAAACVPSGTDSASAGVPLCKQLTHIPLTSRYFHDKQLYFNQMIFLSKAGDIGPCIAKNPVGLPVQLRYLATGDWPQKADAAEQTLQAEYVLEVACCLGAWIVLGLQRSPLINNKFDKAIDVATLFVSFFLLPFCTLLVPYSYGKLIGSTQFTRTTVQQQVGAPEKGGPYFLIERSDNLVSVLSLNGDVPKITVIRNDQIASMEYFGKVDVLKSWNDNCWFNPVSPPPPLRPSTNSQPTATPLNSHSGE